MQYIMVTIKGDIAIVLRIKSTAKLNQGTWVNLSGRVLMHQQQFATLTLEEVGRHLTLQALHVNPAIYSIFPPGASVRLTREIGIVALTPMLAQTLGTDVPEEMPLYPAQVLPHVEQELIKTHQG